MSILNIEEIEATEQNVACTIISLDSIPTDDQIEDLIINDSIILEF